VNRQIVQAMIAFTFGPQDAYPRLTIGRPDEVPIETVIEGVQRLVPLGLRVEASQLRDRLGLSEPGEEAEVLAPRAVPSAAPAEAPPANLAALNAARLRGAEALGTPEAVERLTQRLAEDAAGAMAGLTREIRAEFAAARDMQDLARRLARMQLDPAQLAEALGRGMAIAHLAGQAALLDELDPARSG
jgi:phage gp29-like protein